ncbi:MAG TPA: LAGLIDADG endonuclease [Candidatus Paceibacterota bacterium]
MTKKLSAREKEIIIGTILGDGHFAMLKTNTRLEIGHSEKQKDYVFWKHRELPNIVGAKPYQVFIDDERYGKTWERWSFSTRISSELSEFRKMFYQGKKKIIPKDIGLLLTSPLSLAVWFMDDGGRRNDSYGLFLNTLSFTKEEHELLMKVLKDNFSLESRMHWIQDGYRIYIPSKEAQKFCTIVYPHMLPSMYYKLSFNPVTTSYARLDRARDRKS